MHLTFFVTFLLITSLSIIYLIPSFIAALKYHHTPLAIFILNLIVGWTFIGWVTCLLWACKGKNNLNKQERKVQFLSTYTYDFRKDSTYFEHMVAYNNRDWGGE